MSDCRFNKPQIQLQRDKKNNHSEVQNNKRPPGGTMWSRWMFVSHLHAGPHLHRCLEQVKPDQSHVTSEGADVKFHQPVRPAELLRLRFWPLSVSGALWLAVGHRCVFSIWPAPPSCLSLSWQRNNKEIIFLNPDERWQKQRWFPPPPPSCSKNKWLMKSLILFSPCLRGFSPGSLRVLRLPPTVQKHAVRLTGDSKLSLGVSVVVCLCVALWWTGDPSRFNPASCLSPLASRPLG